MQGVKSLIWATKQNLNPDPVPKPCSFYCIRSQGPSFRQSPAFMEIVQITPSSAPVLWVLPSSPLLDIVFCFLSCNLPSPTPILWILIPGFDLKDSPRTFCFSCPWPPGVIHQHSQGKRLLDPASGPSRKAPNPRTRPSPQRDSHAPQRPFQRPAHSRARHW